MRRARDRRIMAGGNQREQLDGRDPRRLPLRGVQARRRSLPARGRRGAARRRAVPRLYRGQKPLSAGQRAGARRGGLRGARLRLQGLGRERGAAQPPRPARPGGRHEGGAHLPRRAAGGGRGASRALRHQLWRGDGGVDRRHRPPGALHGERRRDRPWRALDAQRAPARRVPRPARPRRRRPAGPGDGGRVRARRAHRNPAAGPPVGRRSPPPRGAA